MANPDVYYGCDTEVSELDLKVRKNEPRTSNVRRWCSAGSMGKNGRETRLIVFVKSTATLRENIQELSRIFLRTRLSSVTAKNRRPETDRQTDRGAIRHPG